MKFHTYKDIFYNHFVEIGYLIHKFQLRLFGTIFVDVGVMMTISSNI